MAEDGGDQGGSGGGETTFKQADIDTAVKEALAGAKSNDDVAFQNLWKEGKEAKAALKAFEGLDAKEGRDAIARLKELETAAKAGELGVDTEKVKVIRKEVEEELQELYAPVKKDNETLKGKLRELQLDNQVKNIMAKQGVRAERIDTLFRLAADKFDLDDDGEPMLAGHPGKDVPKYITEVLGEEYPEFWPSSGSSGGGASRSAGGAGGVQKQIALSDKKAISGSLEDIASGKVVVTQ